MADFMVADLGARTLEGVQAQDPTVRSPAGDGVASSRAAASPGGASAAAMCPQAPGLDSTTTERGLARGGKALTINIHATAYGGLQIMRSDDLLVLTLMMPQFIEGMTKRWLPALVVGHDGTDRAERDGKGRPHTTREALTMRSPGLGDVKVIRETSDHDFRCEDMTHA